MIRRGFFVGEDQPQNVPMERLEEVSAQLHDWGFCVECEQLTFLTPAQLDVLVEQAHTVKESRSGYREWSRNKPCGELVFQPLTLRTLDWRLARRIWEKRFPSNLVDRRFLRDIISALCISEESHTTAIKEFGQANFRNHNNRLAAIWELTSAGIDKADVLTVALDQCRNSVEMLTCILTACHPRGVIVDAPRLRTQDFRLRMESIPRRLRVAIVAALSRCGEDWDVGLLARHRRLWQLVLAKVHPYDVRGWEQARFQLDVIHGNREWETPIAQLDRAFARRDAAGALTVAAKHPGLLMRKLRQLVILIENDVQLRAKLLEVVQAAAWQANPRTVMQARDALLLDDDQLTWVLTKDYGWGMEPQGIPTRTLVPGHVDVEDLVKVLDTVVVENLGSTRAPAPAGIDGAGAVLRIFGLWWGWDFHMDVTLLDDSFQESPEQVTVQNIRGNQMPGTGIHYVDIDPLEASARYAVVNLSGHVCLGEVFNRIGVYAADPDSVPDAATLMHIQSAGVTHSSENNCFACVIDIKERTFIWLDMSTGMQWRGKFRAENRSGLLLQSVLKR